MLKVGDEAPGFILPSHLGRNVTLFDYRGKKNVLLVFYPLNWTPVCSGQIPGYQEVLERFRGLTTEVLAVSVDSIPSHKSWAYSMGGIDFPLLSDFWPHGEIAEKYHAMTEAGHTERLIIVIDKQGIIQYIDYHDIDDEPDVEEVFKVLKSLK
ncbi:MAG: redoxin domain-containing protein [candidate division Zixibacteria bacterium]|nr:redoxin domain-containing protein [candidate division Zixibacteria bacterium]